MNLSRFFWAGILLVALFQVIGAAVTINACKLQFPQTIPSWPITTLNSSAIYGRVISYGITDNATLHYLRIPPPGITAQLGWGASGVSFPQWYWQDAIFNTGYHPVDMNDPNPSPGYDPTADEFQSYLQPNQIGNFHYSFRFSGDGGSTWTYCDWNENNPALINATGSISVLPNVKQTPPLTPTISLTSNTNIVVLSWTNLETDIAGYDIYRRDDTTTTFVKIGNSLGTNFTDTLSQFHVYYYYVIPFDIYYNYGSPSNMVTYANTIGVFPTCISINSTEVVNIQAKMCVNVQFTNCQFVYSLSVDNVSIYNSIYSITKLTSVFNGQLSCDPIGVLDCSVCPIWTNTILNNVLAQSCGSLLFNCPGVNVGPFNVGCFQNTEISQKCFGNCPNYCNFKGVCNNGACNCDVPSNSDCSIPTSQCPNNCGNSGTCINNTCVCSPGYSGPSCSVEEGTSQGGNSKRAYIIGFLVSFGGLAVIIVAIIVIIRIKRQRPFEFKGLSRDSSTVELDQH